MHDQITISPEYNGPPTSGHGGYSCGIFAKFVNAFAQVTLRNRVPLDRSLAVEKMSPARANVKDGEAVIAEVETAQLELDPPKPPSMDEASAARAHYPGFAHHAYPTCFGCGTARSEENGLCIYPGPVNGTDLLAAPWSPKPWLAGDDGLIRSEYIWSALDCPNGWAIAPADGQAILLGRMTAGIEELPVAGDQLIVIGWPVKKEGRKITAGSALYFDDGRLCAKAQGLWFEVPV